MEELAKFLKEKKEKGLLRTLNPVSLRDNSRIAVRGKEYIDFSSNDYLGLSGHPKLIETANAAMDKFGTSSSASRLLSGDLELHHELEDKIAQFKNKEAALVFNSGYQANTGIISALYGKSDCIFSDHLNHASIIDGILLSGAKMFRFQHNDVLHLESLLKQERGKFKKALIVTESIFSMDGDKCPLKDLVRLKKEYDCKIMVDEAHATGIFGKNGSGIVEEEGLENDTDYIMGTFGKALGGFGAYLAASKTVIQYLINECRSFIYSTALPPGVIAVNLAAIQLIKEEGFRRERLLNLAGFLRDGLKEKGFKVRGESQIIPVIVGDNFKVIELAKRLQEKGFWVLPIRPPTVPQKESRLRISLNFNHSNEILERLKYEICSIKI